MLYGSSATVRGTANDNLAGVQAITCDGLAATMSSGEFSCDVSLTPGVVTVNIQAADHAGNMTEVPWRIAVGAPLTITPTNVTLAIGSSQSFQLIDDQGRPAIVEAQWSTSDAAVLSLSTEDGVIVTGRAVGEATLSATVQGVTVQASITIAVGTELAAGTMLWSVPPTPSATDTQSTVLQAQNDDGDGADLFWVEVADSGVYIRG